MRDLIGIAPDYVMVTRFPFFEQMVDDIGGITVLNPRRFADPYLKQEGFRDGPDPARRLRRDGVPRIRKGLPGGDFDRRPTSSGRCADPRPDRRQADRRASSSAA